MKKRQLTKTVLDLLPCPYKDRKDMLAVLVALRDGNNPPTKRNPVVAPLCQAHLIRVTEYQPNSATAKTIELTDMGKIVADKIDRS